MTFELLERRNFLATFTVTSPFDGTPGDLRSAVLSANLTPGADTIEFAVSNIQLTLGEIGISDNVLLAGATAPGGMVTIVAAPNSRIFNVDNTLPSILNVEMHRLTLRGGNAVEGGAVHNREDLSIRESIITGNTADFGGGISNSDGRMQLTDTIVYDNQARHEGGGIRNIQGFLELHRSEVRVNRVLNAIGSSTFGGGIQNIGQAGSILIDSMVMGNTAHASGPGAMGHGGGISTMLQSTTHLINSIVGDNYAQHHGGGMFAVDDSVTIVEQNSIISGNVSGEAGGGIYLRRGHADIVDSAVSVNLTDKRGGGISAGTDVTLNVTRSNISDNRTDLLMPDGSGGGMYLSGFGTPNGPRVVVTASQIERNNYSPAGPHGGEFGGGISVHYGTRVEIDQSNIIQNGANISGGGVYSSDKFTPHAPHITITNSTLSRNVGTNLGGGISMAGGILEFFSSSLRGNRTLGRGGGMFLTGLGSPQQLLTIIQDSAITANVGEIEGGGIAAGPAMHLSIVKSQVENNRTFGKGGALYSTALNLPMAPNITVITASQISGNTALFDPSIPLPMTSYASAGGVWGGPGAMVSINETIVSNNLADRFGGGVFMNQAAFDVRNSTFHDNQSGLNGGGAHILNADGLFEQNTFFANKARDHGGAISLSSFLQNQVTLTHNTISFNQSDSNLSGVGTGGGVFVSNAPATNIQVELTNSIVADNYSGSVLSLPHNSDLTDGPGLAGNPPVVARYNLIGSSASNTLFPANPDPNGNIVGSILATINPMLDPLGNNGGPTQTMMPQAGSLAIDAGDPLFASPPFFDQRGAGFVRVAGGRLDMGAVEIQSSLPHPDLNGDGLVDCTDINLLTQTIASGVYISGVDMNGDGVLDVDDIERWLCKAGDINLGPGISYRFGDANLDGTVDGVDFLIWNSNKFTANASWCAGDFNGDGFVDGLDFLAWNASKFPTGPLMCNPLPITAGGCQSVDVSFGDQAITGSHIDLAHANSWAHRPFDQNHATSSVPQYADLALTLVKGMGRDFCTLHWIDNAAEQEARDEAFAQFN